MQVEDFIARLQGVQRRGPSRWVARCPAHKDRTPSLSIKAESDGRILLHDFGGCEVTSVLDAVGLELRDLMPPRALTDHVPAQRYGAHLHAACDVLKVMAFEAQFLAMFAHDLIEVVTPQDRARVIESETRLRAALRMVSPT